MRKPEGILQLMISSFYRWSIPCRRGKTYFSCICCTFC